MNNIDPQFQNLLSDILNNGVKKETRNGETLSVFGRTIRHKMSEGFPLLTTKKMYWKGIVTELLWFLKGDTNIKYLVDNDCHIWDGDCFHNFLRNLRSYVESIPDSEISIPNKEEFINKIKTNDEFAKIWGELGPVYGKQWRRWEADDSDAPRYEHLKKDIDQIQNLISELKTNPDSRRMMVSAWNVGELDQMTLPPCHYGFQVYTRELSRAERVEIYNSKFENKIEIPFIKMKLEDGVEKTIDIALNQVNIPTRAISLMYNARSQDVPLGTPFNIASYALLLEIIAKMVNMVPDELITNMGDCHIYLNQIDGVKEQITREPYPLPKLVISNQVNFNEGIDEFLNSCSITDFKIEGYQSHPTIKIPLSN